MKQQQAQGEPTDVFDLPNFKNLGLSTPTPLEYATALRERWKRKHEVALQSHREAIALKDAENAKLRAALDGCVEAMRGYVKDRKSEAGLYEHKHYARVFDAAITQAEEAL